MGRAVIEARLRCKRFEAPRAKRLPSGAQKSAECDPVDSVIYAVLTTVRRARTLRREAASLFSFSPTTLSFMEIVSKETW